MIIFAGTCIDLHRPDDAIDVVNKNLENGEPYPELRERLEAIRRKLGSPAK